MQKNKKQETRSQNSTAGIEEERKASISQKPTRIRRAEGLRGAIEKRKARAGWRAPFSCSPGICSPGHPAAGALFQDLEFADDGQFLHEAAGSVDNAEDGKHSAANAPDRSQRAEDPVKGLQP